VATEYVIDAHALIFFHAGGARLGPEARRVMEDPKSVLVLPAIALAEACWVLTKKRVLGVHANDVLQAVDADPRVSIASLTRDIVAATLSFPPGLEMHDRQIVATVQAIIGQGRSAALLTQDDAIVKSGLVPVVW
jgi:predicted nucleic acid-binding protein